MTNENKISCSGRMGDFGMVLMSFMMSTSRKPSSVDVGFAFITSCPGKSPGRFTQPAAKTRSKIGRKDFFILDSLKTHDFSRVMQGEAKLLLHRKTLGVFLVKHNESGIPSSSKPPTLVGGYKEDAMANVLSRVIWFFILFV
jgi:hypothetical protein